jgi:hypothetical protein
MEQERCSKLSYRDPVIWEHRWASFVCHVTITLLLLQIPKYFYQLHCYSYKGIKICIGYVAAVTEG